MELIFQFIFHLNIFILKDSSKWCLVFSDFSVAFKKSANFWHQQLLVNHILKECLISKDLQIISNKADTVLISVCLSCTTENFKAIL